MTANNRSFVINSNEGVPGVFSDGARVTPDALTQVFTTRGSLNLALNRLPNANDLSVRPSDPLIAYDAFLVSVAGTPVAGVTGVASLNVGDYLVLVNDAAIATAASWTGIVNSVIPPVTGNPYYGAVNYARVLSERLPFFPAILAAFVVFGTLANMFSPL